MQVQAIFYIMKNRGYKWNVPSGASLTIASEDPNGSLEAIGGEYGAGIGGGKSQAGGHDATTISPKSNLTYAKTIQAIKNLLVESKLISQIVIPTIFKMNKSLELLTIAGSAHPDQHSCVAWSFR
jgi:hypothetical protein